jgi:hypothetical protein
MGYIPTFTPATGNDPSSQDFQTAGMFENDGKGEVFRYKNNGVNFSDYPYSEIAFQSTYGSVEGAKIPIDSVNIKSTGNILNSAGNGYSLKADSLNMGIGGGDRSNAVITADAAGNVTIEAANSITLKVGRTTLSISDTSFSVESQIADTPVSNTWDAGISLSPRGGFSASGMNCKLNAVKKAVMSDSLGGIFSATMGVGSIKGRELKMATYDATEYKVLNVTTDIEFAENMIALINGMQYQDRQRDMQKNVADQAAKEAVADLADGDADEKKQAAEKALKDAKNAKAALKQAGSPDNGPLWDAFTQAVGDAKKAENARHEAVKTAKEKRDAANQRQNDIDVAADWGNIVNMVIAWAGFLTTLYDTVMSLYEDWKAASTAREKAREMERKARLKNLNLKDLTQEELEDKAKKKAIDAYRAQYPNPNSLQYSKEEEEHWEKMSKEEKNKMIEAERKDDRAAQDAEYQKKLKDTVADEANKELAKKKYDEDVAAQQSGQQSSQTWDQMTDEQRAQKTNSIKNSTDPKITEERDALIEKKVKELEAEKEKAWKTDEIYRTGGEQSLSPSPQPQPGQGGQTP